MKVCIERVVVASIVTDGIFVVFSFYSWFLPWHKSVNPELLIVSKSENKMAFWICSNV